MSPVHTRQSNARRGQRGVSLFFALTALTGLSLAAVAMMRNADTSTVVAGNIGFHDAAVQSSDLAFEAAVTWLATFSKTSASYNDAVGSNYYASIASSMEPSSGRLSASTGAVLVDSATGNTLRYVIERLCSATGVPNRVNCLMEDSVSPLFRVTTLVTGPRNTSETIQHYVVAGGFSATCAILTQQSSSFNGTVSITGSGNCVHSNQNVNWTNSPGSSVGQVSAVGTVGGNVAAAGGTAVPNAPEILIPEIIPGDYRQHADYVLKTDGRVLTRAGALVHNTNTSGAWFGWEIKTTGGITRWEKSGVLPSPEGMYFVEGNVASNANVGTILTPWRIAIFATGSIDLSGGSSVMENYRGNDPTVPQAVKDVFLMAGGDVRFRGSFPPSAVPGSILANEEIDIAGSSGFNGNLIARNFSEPDAAWMGNPASSNVFAGTTTITYNPTGVSLWNSNPVRRQWRTIERLL